MFVSNNPHTSMRNLTELMRTSNPFCSHQYSLMHALIQLLRSLIQLMCALHSIDETNNCFDKRINSIIVHNN